MGPMDALVQGFAPYLAAHRPLAPARWWSAEGRLRHGAFVIESLEEGAAPPPARGACGLAAPCSLPTDFLLRIGVGGPRADQLAALSAVHPRRLMADARAFAASRQRGKRHPLRFPSESLPSLDRRRLALFIAALPILRSSTVVPWDPARPPFLVEADPAAFLASLGLEAHGRSGDTPAAISRRIRIVQSLRCEGSPRDFAVASSAALDALLAAAQVARFLQTGADVPDSFGDGWSPLPPP